MIKVSYVLCNLYRYLHRYLLSDGWNILASFLCLPHLMSDPTITVVPSTLYLSIIMPLAQ